MLVQHSIFKIVQALTFQTITPNLRALLGIILFNPARSTLYSWQVDFPSKRKKKTYNTPQVGNDCPDVSKGERGKIQVADLLYSKNWMSLGTMGQNKSLMIYVIP